MTHRKGTFRQGPRGTMCSASAGWGGCAIGMPTPSSEALFERSPDDHLLLLEHPHVFTLGVRADLGHLLTPGGHRRRAGPHRPRRRHHLPRAGPARRVPDPGTAGEGRAAERPGRHPGLRDVGGAAPHRRARRLRPGGGSAARLPRRVGGCGHRPPRKIAAIGVRLTRADHARVRSQRGTRPVLLRRHRPLWHPRQGGHLDGGRGRRSGDAGGRRRRRGSGGCALGRGWMGAPGRRLAAGPPTWRRSAGARGGEVPRPGPSIRLRGRLAEAGVSEGLAVDERKPEWLRAHQRIGAGYLRLQRDLRDLDLVTVCEEAGCPNISECWADGTATFMINGERCTRACGFCLVDTRHPDPPTRTSPIGSPRPWFGWGWTSPSSPR